LFNALKNKILLTSFNQLQVVIKTADVQYARTDDYVYFGFETKVGQRFEFTLDNVGNDFKKIK